MIGRILSHYRIQSRIGSGGMGVVYRAEDTRLGRVVALKLLNPEFTSDEAVRKRFLIEARAASSLDHPNICPVYEVDSTDEGRLFMTMAYYGGRSLLEQIDRAPLEAREAFGVAYSIARGLECAHRNHIVHRDIKPANIMVSDDGFVRIVDFGLAQLIGETRITQSGATVGTVAYMAPEQTEGADMDGRTDVWALGVVLYEMLTGVRPFTGAIDAAIVYSILNEQHTPAHELVSSVPAGLSHIVDRCLEKNIDKRPDIEALLDELTDLAGKLGWSDVAPSSSIAPISWARRRWRRDKRVRRAVVAALVAALAGASWVGWRALRPSGHTPFVTQTRVAVMPVRNRTGPPTADLAHGLTGVITEIVEDLCRKTISTWVASAEDVALVEPHDASSARGSLGVNRIVSVDVQRFRKRHRVNLRLINARSERTIKKLSVDFDLSTGDGLRGTLAGAIASLLGTPAAEAAKPALPRFLAADYLRARGLTQLHPDSASAILERVRDGNPGFSPAGVQLSLAYNERFHKTGNQGDLDRAVSAARIAGATAPRSPRPFTVLADAFADAGQPDSAIVAAERAVAIAPGYRPALILLSRTLRNEHRFDEAEAVFRRALARRPDEAANLRSLGLYFHYTAEFDSAAAVYSRALEFAPRDPVTINNRGAALLALGRTEEAAECFLTAFRYHPDCLSSSNVGYMYYAQGDFQRAADYYGSAITYCDTTEYDVWGNLAASLIWVEGGRDSALAVYARAIHRTREALAANPDDLDAMTSLIDYYSMSGRREAAARMIVRTLPYVGDNADALFRVGHAWEVLGDRPRALQYIGDALRAGYPREQIESAPALDKLVHDARYGMLVTPGTGASRSEDPNGK